LNIVQNEFLHLSNFSVEGRTTKLVKEANKEIQNLLQELLWLKDANANSYPMQGNSVNTSIFNAKEPKISMHEKFQETRSKFYIFYNKLCSSYAYILLDIQMTRSK